MLFFVGVLILLWACCLFDLWGSIGLVLWCGEGEQRGNSKELRRSCEYKQLCQGVMIT